MKQEEITKARQMDLLTYLRRYEPEELIHFSGSTYCTRTHDSLKISNGMWYWWSRGIGGRSALDYLLLKKWKGRRKRRSNGYSFPQDTPITGVSLLISAEGVLIRRSSDAASRQGCCTKRPGTIIVCSWGLMAKLQSMPCSVEHIVAVPL